MKYVFGFVGCGAGANFFIKQLINNKELFSKCLIHLYEKNPYPFGLIRDGIAPDHQKSKQLIKEFSDNIIKHKNQIEYFGNVNISNINKMKMLFMMLLKKKLYYQSIMILMSISVHYIIRNHLVIYLMYAMMSLITKEPRRKQY